MIVGQITNNSLVIAYSIITCLDKLEANTDPRYLFGDLKNLVNDVYLLGYSEDQGNQNIFPFCLSPAGFLGDNTGDIAYQQEFIREYERHTQAQNVINAINAEDRNQQLALLQNFDNYKKKIIENTIKKELDNLGGNYTNDEFNACVTEIYNKVSLGGYIDDNTVLTGVIYLYAQDPERNKDLTFDGRCVRELMNRIATLRNQQNLLRQNQLNNINLQMSNLNNMANSILQSNPELSTSNEINTGTGQNNPFAGGLNLSYGNVQPSQGGGGIATTGVGGQATTQQQSSAPGFKFGGIGSSNIFTSPQPVPPQGYEASKLPLFRMSTTEVPQPQPQQLGILTEKQEMEVETIPQQNPITPNIPQSNITSTTVSPPTNPLSTQIVVPKSKQPPFANIKTNQPIIPKVNVNEPGKGFTPNEEKRGLSTINKILHVLNGLLYNKYEGVDRIALADKFKQFSDAAKRWYKDIYILSGAQKSEVKKLTNDIKKNKTFEEIYEKYKIPSGMVEIIREKEWLPTFTELYTKGYKGSTKDRSNFDYSTLINEDQIKKAFADAEYSRRSAEGELTQSNEDEPKKSVQDEQDIKQMSLKLALEKQGGVKTRAQEKKESEEQYKKNLERTINVNKKTKKGNDDQWK
jgi:hypothetical protein